MTRTGWKPAPRTAARTPSVPTVGRWPRRHLERRGDAHEGRYQDEDGHGDHHDLRRERADVDDGR